MVEKNLSSRWRKLEELKRGLTKAGFDISRLKTRNKNRDLAKRKEE